LDALDGVGSRVLAYYSKQEASELSDAALSQRSKALSLMAEVASARGDSATALKLYRQALTGTAEAMRRRPDDPGPIFDHAQNVFYVGQIAHADGDFKTAEQSFRDYQRLARAMVALQPDSMKYRMEQQYADFNLGVVLSDERRFDDAVKQFKEALSTMEAITLADPTNDDYRQNIAESLTWLADDERAVGAYDDAIAHRRRNVDLYRQLLAKSGDVQDRQHLIAALRSLADLYEDRGQHGLAEPLLRDAIAQADILEHVEANNAVWIDYAVRSRLDLARVSSLTGRRDEASQLTSAACRAVAALLERKAIKRGLGQDAIACNLARANLALGAGQSDQALAFAQQAVGAAHSARTVDKVADEFRLVRAYLILGDVQQKRGNLAAANATWKSALAAIPSGVREIPSETADHALILQRLGQKDEARPLASKLESMGYRRGFP
jgi:tetratricopeptide (TPR) repeat protein